MQICEITYDSASATDNMAIDATMLDFGGKMGQVMWRLYGWDEPAITFGYSQNWSWIQAYMHDFEGVCIRRTTGGGIVDHRWFSVDDLHGAGCWELHGGFRTVPGRDRS